MYARVYMSVIACRGRKDFDGCPKAVHSVCYLTWARGLKPKSSTLQYVPLAAEPFPQPLFLFSDSGVSEVTALTRLWSLWCLSWLWALTSVIWAIVRGMDLFFCLHLNEIESGLADCRATAPSFCCCSCHLPLGGRQDLPLYPIMAWNRLQACITQLMAYLLFFKSSERVWGCRIHRGMG